MPIDLWGEIPEPEEEKTPFAILRDQASLLQEKTGGLLHGRVRRIKEDSEHLCYMLEIVAPELDNYSFGVLIISYHIDIIYPVKVESLVKHDDKKEDDFICHSEEEFIKILGQILSSKEVRKVIQRLLLHVGVKS